MKTLYPDLEPFKIHTFVRDNHQLYVEECGNRDGLPVVFLHGGPGSGCKPYHRSFFDPEKYHIILFDQRGAGRSGPRGASINNATSNLLEDLEYIRMTLGLHRWLLFGGSWGSTLSLLYAQRYTDRVSGMVLRGSFLARQSDLDWFIGDGVRKIFPDTWNLCFGDILHTSSASLIQILHVMLNSHDECVVTQAVRAWYIWGSQIILGQDFDVRNIDEQVFGEDIVEQARIELHYAYNRYFVAENQILLNCHKLSRIPVILIHGRLDLTCPLESSYLLHKYLPKSQLMILSDAGHTSSGASMIDALVSATDDMLEIGAW